MQTKHSFKYWQWRVIICSMIGYAMFYFVRKNFSFAIPLLQAEYPEITKAHFGAIMSAGGIIYGISKLINGIIGDRTNARWHLVLGLSVCVAVNFLFGLSASLSTMLTGTTDGPDFIGGFITIMSILYIINQIFQGCGFAPCNHLMVSWVPPHELATKMSLWNTSHRCICRSRNLRLPDKLATLLLGAGLHLARRRLLYHRHPEKHAQIGRPARTAEGGRRI